MQIFPFHTLVFFSSQKLSFLWLIGDKTSCCPIRSVIILVILLSLVWLQTELDSTQSYYHYLFFFFLLDGWESGASFLSHSLSVGKQIKTNDIIFNAQM